MLSIEDNSIYRAMEKFCSESNLDMHGELRTELNILLSSSILFAQNSYLLFDIFRNKAKMPFGISTFRFAKIELQLFEGCLNPDIVKAAKKRLSQLRTLDQYTEISFFKSPVDIVKSENLNVPLLIVTCNVNEAIEISRQAQPSSVYIFFDGFEREFFDAEMVSFTSQFMGKIRGTAEKYDKEQLKLYPCEKEPVGDSTYETIVINGSTYNLEEDFWEYPDNGGEGRLFRMKGDAKIIIKLFEELSESKIRKIEYLMTEYARLLPMSSFCPLPKYFVEVKDGKKIGYAMDFIHGMRLDRYVYILESKEETTTKDLIKLFLQITLAVRAVHLSDCVICDLCEYNFMVEENGSIKVVDCDSFQISKYPNDGVHIDAKEIIDEYEGLYLSCNFDGGLLKHMFDSIILDFDKKIQKDYYEIMETYADELKDVCDFLQAFYYYLHSIGGL